MLLLLSIPGIFHQHSRPDRDAFIEINATEIDRVQREDNIFRDTYMKQYATCENCQILGEYDISSIMHYGALLGSQNRTVIVPKPGVCDPPNCNMGQRSTLSIGDIDVIQRLYDCGNYNTLIKL